MAKRVPPLSAAKLAKLKPDPTKTLELVDGAVPGLRIRITPAGTKTWSLNMRANGVMRRFEVGSELGLSDARAKALDLRKSIKEGAESPRSANDPVSVNQAKDATCACEIAYAL